MHPTPLRIALVLALAAAGGATELQSPEGRDAPDAVAGPRSESARGFLGLLLAETGGSGAAVQRVVPGSPAERAGLAAGDRVAAIDGEPVAGPPDVVRVVRARRPGDVVTLAVEDESGEARVVEVELARVPRADEAAPDGEDGAERAELDWESLREDLAERWREFREREDEDLRRLQEELEAGLEELQEHFAEGVEDLQERLERIREEESQPFARDLRARVEEFRRELRQEAAERAERLRALRDDLREAWRARQRDATPRSPFRRHDARAPHAPPAPRPRTAPDPDRRAALEALRDEVRRLREEVDSLRSRVAPPAPPTPPAPSAPSAPPAPPATEEAPEPPRPADPTEPEPAPDSAPPVRAWSRSSV